MGWLAFLIWLLIMASILAGQSNSPGAGTSNSGSGGSFDCTGCNADRDWYHSLRPGKKVIYSAWWATRWVFCKSKGCY